MSKFKVGDLLYHKKEKLVILITEIKIEQYLSGRNEQYYYYELITGEDQGDPFFHTDSAFAQICTKLENNKLAKILFNYE